MFSRIRITPLRKTAIGSLGLKIGAAGLGLINGVLLARLLGPAEYGVYAIALSGVNLAATVAVLGLPMLVTREVAANAEREKWGRLKGILGATHRWTLLAVLAIVGWTTILFVGGVAKPPVSWPLTIIAMLLVAVGAFNQLRAAILRGLNRVILADIPELLLRPAVMLVLLGCVYFTAIHAGAVHALGLQLVAGGFALAAGTWWLATRQPASLKTAAPEPIQSGWLLVALPFLGIALIGALEGQVSLYLLGYLGGAEQAGLFQAANQLVGLIVIGLVAVNMPLQPKLAVAWARGDKQYAQRLITETARMGTAIALAGTLVIMVFAEAVLRIYGDQYVEAAHTMRILAVGQMVNAAAGSCGILLMMAGHQNVVMRGTALALLINVIVAYFTIPVYGAVGGALATMLAMASWNVYFAAYSIIKLDLNPTVLAFLGRV